MRKGCFVKLIFILTIFTAIVLYIIQHKFDDFVLKPGKKIISEFTEGELKKELKHVKESPEKDSLILLTRHLLDGKDGFSKLDLSKAEETFKNIVSDSIVTTEELRQVKSLIGSKK